MLQGTIMCKAWLVAAISSVWWLHTEEVEAAISSSQWHRSIARAAISSACQVHGIAKAVNLTLWRLGGPAWSHSERQVNEQHCQRSDFERREAVAHQNCA